MLDAEAIRRSREAWLFSFVIVAKKVVVIGVVFRSVKLNQATSKEESLTFKFHW